MPKVTDAQVIFLLVAENSAVHYPKPFTVNGHGVNERDQMKSNLYDDSPHDDLFEEEPTQSPPFCLGIEWREQIPALIQYYLVLGIVNTGGEESGKHLLLGDWGIWSCI